MSRLAVIYRRYFPIYLVVKWLLIVAALAFAPKLIMQWSSS